MAREVRTLAEYPYVVVRLGCDVCLRKGRYRLARLSAKYGAEIGLADLLKKLSADCPGWHVRHPAHQQCRARFVDLGTNRPPDAPIAPLMVIAGGKR